MCRSQITAVSASCVSCMSCRDDYCTTFLELSTSTSSLARSTALLANMEEHTGLSRVLSQLAEVEEKLESYHQDQADRDYFVLSELAKDYVGLMGAVKVRGSQRDFTIKWRTWLFTGCGQCMCTVKWIISLQ